MWRLDGSADSERRGDFGSLTSSSDPLPYLSRVRWGLGMSHDVVSYFASLAARVMIRRLFGMARLGGRHVER